MSRYNSAVTSFSSGEISPKLRGRSDIKEYKTGLEEQLNFLPILQGGVTRRPGSKYSATVTEQLNGKEALMLPFRGTDSREYILVIPISDAGPAIDAPFMLSPAANGGTIYAVTVLTSSDYPLEAFATSLSIEGYSYAQVQNKLYLTHSSGTIPPVIFSFDIDGVFAMRHIFDEPRLTAPPLSGEGWRYLLKHPFLDANSNTNTQMFLSTWGFGTTKEINVIGTAVTVTMGDKAGNPITSFWSDDHVGSIFRISTIPGSEQVVMITAVSAPSSTATGKVLVNNDSASTPVMQTSNWRESAWSTYRGWPKVVTGYDQRVIFLGNKERPMGMWASAIFNEEVFMQTYLDQDTGPSSSDTSTLNYFGDEITADLPFNANLSAGFGNEIRWAASGDTLVVGTDRSELTINALDGIFSVSSIEVRAQSFVGGSPVQAQKSSDKILYVGRDGRSLRSFSYFQGNGQFATKNLNVLSDDIIDFLPIGALTADLQGAKIKQTAWQQSRSTLWVLTNNNVLMGLNMNETSETLGWFKMSFGGSLDASGFAEVVSIASATNPNNNFDSLYVLMKRTVNSSTVYYIEEIGDDFRSSEMINTSTQLDEHPYLLDSSKRYETAAPMLVPDIFVSVPNDLFNLQINANQLTFQALHRGQRVQITTTGTLPAPFALATDYYVIPNTTQKVKLALTHADALSDTHIDITTIGTGSHTLVPQDSSQSIWSYYDHLEGETVDILADGLHVGQKVVTGGDITLDTPASEVIIGYNYTARLKTLPLEAGQQFGSSRGNPIRIDRATMLLYNTHYAKFGSDVNDLETMEFDSTPFTGDKRLDFPSSSDTIAQVIVESDKPLPLTISGMVLRGVSYDG